MNPRAILVVFALFFAGGLAPAGATDSHDYAKDEYAIIRDGLAPNKQMSLASHGADENGEGEFHVWLMSESAHRRIARLPASDLRAFSTPDPVPITPPGRRILAMSP